MEPIGEVHPKAEYVLGVDPARMGSDSCVYIIIEKPWGSEIHYVVHVIEERYKTTVQISNKIFWLHSKFAFRKVMIDETGLGSGIVDTCQERLGARAEGVVFTLQSKVDMYSNLQNYMKRGLLKLPVPQNNSATDKYNKLINQLRDMRYEFSKNISGRLFKIHHPERGKDDFCDALALAMFHYKVRNVNPQGRLYVG